MPTIDDLDLRDLRAFHLIVTHAGVRTAARESGIAQPTLSKRLARLEKTLGKKVLTRGSEMRLTADGYRLLPFAQKAIRAAEGILCPEAAMPIDPIRLGLACSACEGLAATFMTAASQDGQTVEPHDGISTDLLRRVQTGDLDAMLGRFRLSDLPKGLEGQLVATDRLGIVCPVGHPLDRDPLWMRDIGTTPIVGFQPELSPGLEVELANCWSKGGLVWYPVRRATGPDSLLIMVQAGVGVTVLPDRAFIHGGNLRFHAIQDAHAISKIILTWRKNESPERVSDFHRWAGALTPRIQRRATAVAAMQAV